MGWLGTAASPAMPPPTMTILNGAFIFSSEGFIFGVSMVSMDLEHDLQYFFQMQDFVSFHHFSEAQ